MSGSAIFDRATKFGSDAITNILRGRIGIGGAVFNEAVLAHLDSIIVVSASGAVCYRDIIPQVKSLGAIIHSRAIHESAFVARGADAVETVAGGGAIEHRRLVGEAKTGV